MKNNRPTNARHNMLSLALLVVLAALTLAGCQGTGTTATGQPRILGFQADDTMLYTAGATTVLRWTLENADGALVQLISSDGGQRTVSGATSAVVTPNSNLATVTYSLVVTRGTSTAESSLTVSFPTATTLSGSLALDNLIEEGNSSQTDAEVSTASESGAVSAGEAFRSELADLLPLVVETVEATGNVSPLSLQKVNRTVDILSRIVAPTSIYAEEAVVLVDANGVIHDSSSVNDQGEWSIDVPRFGTYVLLRARVDANQDLVCFQPLELEERDERGRAASVQPLIVRSTASATETLGRFALNEQSGHLSAVSTAVPLGVLLPDDIAAFFEISDRVLNCEHPSPSKLTVDVEFDVTSPDGDNAPGTFDFGNVWTTAYDEPTVGGDGVSILSEAAFETLASAAVGDEGSNRSDLHNVESLDDTLPIFHDTCLLNFDKCTERFDEGETLLPFVPIEEEVVTSVSEGGVTVLRRRSSVQTATVQGTALNGGRPVSRALILIVNNDTGATGMGRTDRNGNFKISVPLGGRNQFTGVSNVRRVGRGQLDCGSVCTFSSVRTYNQNMEY